MRRGGRIGHLIAFSANVPNALVAVKYKYLGRQISSQVLPLRAKIKTLYKISPPYIHGHRSKDILLWETSILVLVHHNSPRRLGQGSRVFERCGRNI